MADTKIRVPKATDALKVDHDRVKKLFVDYDGVEDGEDTEKYRVFRLIQRELTVHAAIEEDVFYPAVEGVKKRKADGAKLIAEAREEHEVVRGLLEEIAELSPADEAFDPKMKVLRDNVEHHANEEEDKIFDLFDELQTDERERVSEALWERDQDLRQEGRID